MLRGVEGPARLSQTKFGFTHVRTESRGRKTAAASGSSGMVVRRGLHTPSQPTAQANGRPPSYLCGFTGLPGFGNTGLV